MQLNGETRGSRTFVYDFARDGGLVSTINMGVFIPGNSVVYNARAKIDLTFTSGGAPTTSIGSTTAGVAAYIAATALGVLVLNAVVEGAAVTAANVFVPLGDELTITIAVAAMTAGVLRFTCDFIEYPAG